MKKILFFSILFMFLFLYRARPVSAAVCDEFYFLKDDKVVKITPDQPDKAYELASYTPAIPNHGQSFLFRLKNGEFAMVYVGTDKTKKDHRKVFFKNLDTGQQSLVQDVIDRGNGIYIAVTWPRAAQLANGDIYVVFSNHDIVTWEQCAGNKPCLIDARIRVAKSTDNGRTWKLASELTNVLTGDPRRGGLWQPTLIELTDGSLGLLLTEQAIRPPGRPGIRTKADTVSFYVSGNGGSTWHRRSNVYTTFDSVANEGYIIQHPSGKLVTVFGTGLHGQGTIDLSVSDDVGRTWSSPASIADTIYHANAMLPVLQQIRSSYVLLYNKAPNGKEDETRIQTVKVADNLSASAWNNASPHTPAIVGTGAVGLNCGGFPSSVPGDLTDQGDMSGDHVNIYDYNILVGDFGKTGTPAGWIPADIIQNGKVDIFDYNILIDNFGK